MIKPKRGRPTLKSISILKEAKKSITDKTELAQVNAAIKLLQGVSTGNLTVLYTWGNPKGGYQYD